jgi:hypothetical protein
MRVPVVLVAGFSHSARYRLVREALGRAGIPGQAPMAWLNHQDSALALAEARHPLQPNQSFVACVCCAGSLVFTTYLTRLLRQGPWAGLIISLGSRAEPARMLELLNRPPWQEYLAPIRLFSVMDEMSLSLCDQKEHALHSLACQQRNAAERVLGPGESLPENLFDLILSVKASKTRQP